MILPNKIVLKHKAMKSIFPNINSLFYIYIYIFFTAVYEPQFTWLYNHISCTITSLNSALIPQATVRATVTQLAQTLNTI